MVIAMVIERASTYTVRRYGTEIGLERVIQRERELARR